MIRLFTRLIITLFLTTTFVGKEAVSADFQEGSGWEIKNFPNVGYVQAAIPGEITYGDKQRFLFYHGHCNEVVQNFNFYTIRPNDFKKLEGKVMAVEVDGKKLGAKILYTFKAMSGHIAWFDFGIYNKDDHLQFLRKSKKISIKLVDGNGLVASEYFDVLENEWSLEGIEDAFSRAHAMCLRSTSQ